MLDHKRVGRMYLILGMVKRRKINTGYLVKTNSERNGFKEWR